MALGAEHVEAPQLAHLVALGLGLGLVPGGELLEPRPVLLGVGIELLGPQVALGQALGVAAEDDVDAAAGHVGGHRDAVEPTGLGDDVGLPECPVRLGVEHLVGDALLVEQARQALGLLDRDRAHQHRLAGLVALGDVVGDRLELGFLRLVDEVALVHAYERHVGGDGDHLQLVRGGQLGGVALRRAGHAGQLLVHAEVVLERDGGERLVLFLDPDALFGLDRLVQALRPAPALEDAAGELVDDLHLAADDHVVLVALEQLLGPRAAWSWWTRFWATPSYRFSMSSSRSTRSMPSSVGETVRFSSSTS